MERLTKREIAHEVLRDLFQERRRITIAEAVAAGNSRDVSRRTLQRAMKELGAVEVHNGNQPAFWELQTV